MIRFLSTLFFISLALFGVSKSFGNTYGDNLQLKEIKLQLSHHFHEERLAIEMFDEMTSKWIDYSSEVNGFNIDSLIKAANLLITKEIEFKSEESSLPHVIRITSILWNEGRVRSVNTLIAALLDHIEEVGVTDNEILEAFGTRVLLTLNEDHPPTQTEKEHRKAHLDLAPTQSINGQMIQLAHCIENLRYKDRLSKLNSTEKLEYLKWHEDLLSALHGANSNLENALKQEITKNQ